MTKQLSFAMSKYSELNGKYVYTSKIQSGILETLSITKHLFLKNSFILPQFADVRNSLDSGTVLLPLRKI